MALTVGLWVLRLVPWSRAGLGRVFPRCCRAGPSVTRGEIGRSTRKKENFQTYLSTKCFFLYHGCAFCGMQHNYREFDRK